MSHDHDTITNNSNNEHFQAVLDRAIENPTRRSMLRGGFGLAAMFALPMLPGCGSGVSGSRLPALSAATTLGFSAVDKSLADSVIVPPGYTVRVLHATGDTLNAVAPAYSNVGTETGESWAFRVGDHHDGMELYYIGADGKFSRTATNKAVLAVNHESSADAHLLMPRGQTSGGETTKKFDQFGSWDVKQRPADEVLKEINLHGISVVEVTLDGTGKPTGYNATSPLNRRITPQTLANITGPAAEMANLRNLMKTKFDTTGATARGTLNNCGHGTTPWGTYLGCEENWNVYFNIPSTGTAPTGKLLAARARYGVAAAPLASNATAGSGQGWYTPTDAADTDSRFSRWNATVGTSETMDFRNEPNTFGYNLEIDPTDPLSVPAKRTAMGRFRHEAAVCGNPVVGKPLAFYMGCDQTNEYIYKFVTAANWDEADIGRGMAAGDKYLTEGKLYVAKFNSDGKGEWLELNYSNPVVRDFSVTSTINGASTTFTYANQAEVLVYTRFAADAVGGTKMDRPEWGAVNYANGEVYFALTNNTGKTPANVNPANPRAFNDLDGTIKRAGNPNGLIIRFKETGNLSTATTFTWDIFLFGAEEDSLPYANISQLNSKNSLSSPDGLWFSKSTGICWIQTDDGAFTDETNCMLLAAVPGSVGDGGEFVVENTLSVTSSGTTTTTMGSQKTFVGGILGESRLRRFLVAPKGAEVTGLTETADGKTIFVNIQHPGENTAKLGTAANFTFESQWPGNGGGVTAPYGVAGRPRSATLMITKNDGGKIGL
jgi:secreted PhoX family phosphatase